MRLFPLLAFLAGCSLGPDLPHPYIVDTADTADTGDTGDTGDSDTADTADSAE